ncbi:MAG: hypothetical protein SF052_03630 [Bacteroidia bacterium]|nr:hypothetical protein [Bacteroidia bacterium]
MLTDVLRETIIQNITSTNPRAFVVDLRLKRGKQSVLSIKVDTDQGISLAECAKISRELGMLLENEPEMNFPYHLEVSSPGVGYPLMLHRQYINNIGRHLQIIRNDHSDIKGKLIRVEETFLELEPLADKRKKKTTPPEENPAIIQIAFNDIKEAKVIIIF